MSGYSYAEARQRGFACPDHPSKRVAAAVALYVRKPIGVKWHVDREYEWLAEAVRELPREQREKVCLTFVKSFHLRGDAG